MGLPGGRAATGRMRSATMGPGGVLAARRRDMGPTGLGVSTSSIQLGESKKTESKFLTFFFITELGSVLAAV